MSTILLAHDRAVLHGGDALVVLPTLPTGSVDLVLTDPPYNSGGRTQSDRTKVSARDKYVSGDAAHTLATFDGDNRDQRSYTAWLALVLAHCLRTSRPGASLLVFTDWRQLPATSDALQAGGWLWRGIVPWHKPISRPRAGGFKAECEYLLWGSNGPIDATRNPVYLPGLYSASQPRGRNRQHITEKPVALLAELAQVCVPGGTVLDPFAGSGSTGAAALSTGRRFVGVELSEHYQQVAAQRLRDAAGRTLVGSGPGPSVVC
ncbi:DNA-methyltransferase [Micromonospora carbonacea]|uniref:Methyltransferase n=1 Tax=Micromonospora carbonacea TaxID=47853 RepID=A0A1C4X1R9_9ACTN|nr:site-specific DNA-methyltransferase [Micromonospora carbonacea]SCF02061.1 site-specific DNA-methyltransferase (adenine-specific) [Micromonospora carbonacea]